MPKSARNLADSPYIGHMETTELIKHFKYGTLETMAKDLADQIEDCDSFFEDSQPDEEDLIRHSRLVKAFAEVVKIYCGEGGCPIADISCAGIERLVDRHCPEIKDGLRSKWW
jgi:hypothetical protein